ncbi:MAG TPA: CocE/NonD family hydrolase C-terminal non-catalytic domain-containing protein, partial [Phenylobacterium sp.]
LLVARLRDVAPDGQAVRRTTGALNLAFVDGTGLATPPVAGEPVEVTLPFQATAWRLKVGHRLGLLLSADGWPTLWPERSGATLTLDRGSLLLSAPTTETDPARPFEPAATAPAAAMGAAKWLDVSKEALLPTGLTGAAAHAPEAFAYHRAATGTDYRLASRFELALTDGGRQAVAAKVYRAALERPGWSIRVNTRLVVRSTPSAFEIAWTVQGIENGAIVFDRSGQASVPRATV